MSHSHSVLLDLSSILYGKFPFSGIPQETRLLFKIFSDEAAIQPHALLCSQHKMVMFPSDIQSVNTLLRTLSYTQYFRQMANLPLPYNWLRYQFIKFNHYLKIFFKKNYQIQPLDKNYLDLIWRAAFNDTIDSRYKEEILNQSFHISDFDKFVLSARIFFKLPLPTLQTKGMDFAIFQNSLPQTPLVSAGTIPIVRFHDAVPLFFPETINKLYYSKLFARSLASSTQHAIFVCNSLPVSKDLIQFAPHMENKTFVIPPPIEISKKIEKNDAAIPFIVAARQLKSKKVQSSKETVFTFETNKTVPMDFSNYIISVSTLEPRKNFLSLIHAWEKIRYQRDASLKLMIVGTPGWKCQPVLDAMKLHVMNGDIIHLEHVPTHELNLLYASAKAFVFPTYYEGFGITPLEAMQAGCPTIVSDTPVTRWVLDDSTLYCDPYKIESISGAIEKLLYSDESPAMIHQLKAKGHQQALKYAPSAVGEKWLALFDHLRTRNGSKEKSHYSSCRPEVV